MVLVGYFHIPGTVVPHVRFLSNVDEDDVLLGVEAALHEWPTCDRVEIYDECDRVILKQDRMPGRRLSDA